MDYLVLSWIIALDCFWLSQLIMEHILECFLISTWNNWDTFFWGAGEGLYNVQLSFKSLQKYDLEMFWIKLLRISSVGIFHILLLLLKLNKILLVSMLLEHLLDSIAFLS